MTDVGKPVRRKVEVGDNMVWVGGFVIADPVGDLEHELFTVGGHNGGPANQEGAPNVVFAHEGDKPGDFEYV